MSDVAAPPGGRRTASSKDAPEASDRRRADRREPERAGLYPPRHSGRSPRMIGEVVVDLGLADKETVEEAVALARAQGRPTGLVPVEQGVRRRAQRRGALAGRL